MLSDHIWCVRRSTLDEIRVRALSTAITSGQHLDLLAPPQQAGGPLDANIAALLEAESRAWDLQVDGGVTVITLRGLISPYSSLISLLMYGGGGSLQVFRSQLREALSNDDVQTIVINIDSPGGISSLVAETAAELAAASKPTIAIANTLTASAAYWIAAAADEVVVTPSGYVGSVGAYRLHEDYSGFNERFGVDPTYIYAGAYKVEGNPDYPLDAEGRAAWQRDVNDCYDMFVDAVAAGRGVKAAVVKENYGEGRVLNAKNALAAGMVDRIESLEQAVGRVIEKPSRRSAADVAREQTRILDEQIAAQAATAEGARDAEDQLRAAAGAIGFELPAPDGRNEIRSVALSDVESRSTDDGKLIVSGYAAVFEAESVNLGGYIEVIKRGAFRKVLKSNPDVRWRADHFYLPLARTTNGTLRLWEDAKGLRFKAELIDVQASRDLVAMIKRGDVSQMSFMFRVQEGGREWTFPKEQSELPRRTIHEFSELFELAAVTFSAYPQTTISVGPDAAAAASDGRLDAGMLRELIERIDAGQVEANTDERREVARAAEILNITAPWQSEHAPRATGDEPEGVGATAEPPGETDPPDTDAEGQAYGLAARSRRLSLVELDIELDG